MKHVDQANFLGGEGIVHFDHILEADEMHGMNRVYAKVTLPSGSSIGYHVHSGDGEDYYVLKGVATINNNNEEIIKLKPGEHFYTPSGKGHSLLNEGSEDLEIMALIIYDHENTV